jgi:hypothetical protein
VSGTSNGDPAQLVYFFDYGRNNQTAPQTINLQSVGGFSQEITTTTPEFAQNVTLDVRLVDSSPGGRGEDRGTSSTVSGVPQPGVSVSKGAFCTDGNTDPKDDCWDGKTPPYCDVAECAFVDVTVSGYYESYQCTISGAGLAQEFSNNLTNNTNPWGGSITHNTTWYARQAPTVTCTGTGVFGRVSSGTAPSW